MFLFSQRFLCFSSPCVCRREKTVIVAAKQKRPEKNCPEAVLEFVSSEKGMKIFLTISLLLLHNARELMFLIRVTSEQLNNK